VRRTGRSFAHPFVVLMIHASDAPRVRVGVTAGRSVGGAVKRNKAKRLLREAMRPLLPDLLPNWDLILIARPALLSRTLQEIRRALVGLLLRAQVILTINEA
jgi:ribonuclease P protein component